ncbi:FG-GAP repeat domain-containing protein [Euzebya rosea]|uniref:FG-GAP repeat domain-containing protein n=1 Tax=Euzebya rosea TaxID=2052804 RepID=UPI000D3E741B|nr:VCBS repeat-containing protein [Euzebya rosea]
MATERPGTDPRVVGVITGVVVVLLVLVVVGLVTAGNDGDEIAIDGQLTATPVTSATDATEAQATETAPTAPEPGEESTTAGATPPPATAEPSGDDGDTTGPVDTDGEPTDGDAAAFVESLTAGEVDSSDVVLADLDADGRNEVVVAGLLGGRSRIDVARWNGTTYVLADSGEGGSAEAIESVRVADVNSTPDSAEIVVRQTSGGQGESITLWSLVDGEVVPLRAAGGCWDGSHTYGIVGAEIRDGRITATCDGSPDPIVAWPSDVYEWAPEDGVFLYVETLD